MEETVRAGFVEPRHRHPHQEARSRVKDEGPAGPCHGGAGQDREEPAPDHAQPMPFDPRQPFARQVGTAAIGGEIDAQGQVEPFDAAGRKPAARLPVGRGQDRPGPAFGRRHCRASDRPDVRRVRHQEIVGSVEGEAPPGPAPVPAGDSIAAAPVERPAVIVLAPPYNNAPRAPAERAGRSGRRPRGYKRPLPSIRNPCRWSRTDPDRRTEPARLDRVDGSAGAEREAGQRADEVACPAPHESVIPAKAGISARAP